MTCSERISVFGGRNECSKCIMVSLDSGMYKDNLEQWHISEYKFNMYGLNYGYPTLTT